MPAKSVMWSGLAAVCLMTAGCQTGLIHDAGQAPPPAARGAAPANLRAAMDDMQKLLTAIRAEAVDETKAEQALIDLATFERDVAIVKTMNPPLGKLDDATKETAPAFFRTAMSTLMRTALNLEDAIISKNKADIKEMILRLDETERAGHEEFNVG